MRSNKTATRAPRTKGAALRVETPHNELPPPSPEALAIDQAARAQEHPEAQATSSPQGDDLGAAITTADQAAADADAKAQAEEISASGTAQVFLMLATKIVAHRFPGVTFSDDEKSEAVRVLVPVIKKYDLAEGIFERWKEEFAAGMFFAGLFAAKRAQYVEALAQAEEKKRQEKNKDGDASGAAT